MMKKEKNFETIIKKKNIESIVKKSVLIVLSVFLCSFSLANVAVMSDSSLESTVTVEPQEFLKYFQRNGSAANFEYDTSTWTQTLTPDARKQSGNVTLMTKVDMTQNFKFDGLVNLGSKSMANGGADGIGFMFHPGNVNVVGAIGNGMGIGGVPGAFGFKLDTYYNGESTFEYTKDPDRYRNNTSFGAFVDGRNGVATTIEEGSQVINNPQNNEFVPFSITYTGSTKVMSVSYGSVNWNMDISLFIGDEPFMSFAIVASTGDNSNLQQIRNVSFTYTMAQGRVIAKYVDENGVPLSEDIMQQGNIGDSFFTEQKSFDGYTLKDIQGEPSGNYTPNDQFVTYIYSKTTEPSTTEPSTTEPSTTEPSTTEPSTTEPSTTEPSTTEPSTTEPSTTEPSTTEPSTTEPSTTEPSTTEPSTTEPSTTEPSTTEPSTTEPSTTEPSTTEPSTTEPSTTEPSTTEPSTTEPSTTEPSTTEPSTTEPSTTEPSTTEPSTTEPSTTEPSTTEPSTTEPSTTEPSTTEPSTTEPSTTEPSTTEPSTTEPSTTEPSTTEPSTTEPSTTEPSTTEPSTTEPSTTEPSTTEPGTTEPSTTEPSTTEPSTTEPSITKPSKVKPSVVESSEIVTNSNASSNNNSFEKLPKTNDKKNVLSIYGILMILVATIVILKNK
jgi:hypothetical protein